MKYYTDGKRHLVCVPYSIQNLHAMAKDLGIGRWWFHKNHYDIPKKRIDEIESRCIMVSPKSIVHIIRGEFESEEQQKAFDDNKRHYLACGFAPGNYLAKCLYCDQTFQGDKRATCCFGCATNRLGETHA